MSQNNSWHLWNVYYAKGLVLFLVLLHVIVWIIIIVYVDWENRSTDRLSNFLWIIELNVAFGWPGLELEGTHLPLPPHLALSLCMKLVLFSTMLLVCPFDPLGTLLIYSFLQFWCSNASALEFELLKTSTLQGTFPKATLHYSQWQAQCISSF